MGTRWGCNSRSDLNQELQQDRPGRSIEGNDGELERFVTQYAKEAFARQVASGLDFLTQAQIDALS